MNQDDVESYTGKVKNYSITISEKKHYIIVAWGTTIEPPYIT